VKLADNIISLGTGLYTLGEVAMYARMHPITVSRWFKGDDYCKRVLPLEDAKVITFVDLMQVMAVRNLRVTYNVPLPKIRAAVVRAKENFSVDYPFAQEHTTYIFDGEVWIKPGGVSNETFIQLSGRAHGQQGITTVVERFMKDVSFNPVTKLANMYRAFHRDGHDIYMNPDVRFGEPILAGTGYTPHILFEAVKTEGSVEAAAKAYDVPPEKVEFCIDYIDYLQAKAA